MPQHALKQTKQTTTDIHQNSVTDNDALYNVSIRIRRYQQIQLVSE